MKEQPQPDTKKAVAPGHGGYGPMVAITGGTVGLVGDPDTSTSVRITASAWPAEKTYQCGTHARAQALVGAVQNNLWIYDAQDQSDSILLVGQGDTSAAQLWANLAGVPTIDPSDPQKVKFTYSMGTPVNPSVVVTFRDSNATATPANVVAFVQTLVNGGWPPSAMRIGLGSVASGSTGPVIWESEAGWLCVGLVLPTS